MGGTNQSKLAEASARFIPEESLTAEEIKGIVLAIKSAFGRS